MAPPSKGSKAGRGRNHFNAEWLKRKDCHGDLVGDYIVKVGEFAAKCQYCKKEINSIGNMGFGAIRAHYSTNLHKNTADMRKGRETNQFLLVRDDDGDRVRGESDNEDTAVDDPPPGTSANVLGSGGFGSQTKKAGIMKFLTSQVQTHQEDNNNADKQRLSLTEKVARAEIRLILHSVNKNNSLKSLDELEESIKMSFDDSKIAQSISIGKSKASYVITEALGPFFLDEALKDIKKSEVFVIGTDTATTKFLGLAKSMDIKIRYYSETYQRVCDVYVCTANLGHETKEVLLNVIIEKAKELGLDLVKLFALSRDNPNVMKGFGQILSEKVTSLGNPKLIQAPCTLHPTHTSLKEGLTKMDLDVDLFLVDIHGWFKLSTGRRQDLKELREQMELEGEMEAFLRHVSSRWCTMGPTVERILKHWRALCEYFCEYLHNSTEKSHIEQRKTERYQRIVNILKPSVRKLSFARLKMVVYLCNKTQSYLKTFQAVRPMVHKLHMESCLLIINLLTSVVKAENIPNRVSGRELVKLKFYDKDDKETRKLKNEAVTIKVNDEDVTLDPDECDFGVAVPPSVSECKHDAQILLRKEFKSVMLKMIRYLMSHLPIEDKFLMDLAYSNPSAINEEKFVLKMLNVAKHTQRFTEGELERLDNQLKSLKLLTKLPTFDENVDVFEKVWMELIDRLQSTMGVEALELSRLIKIISCYPNSQGWIERGFNDTKRISEFRQNVSEKSMEAQKIILDVIRQAGSTAKVHITSELVGAHLSARQTYRARLEKEKKEKEAEERQRKRNAELEAKKRKHEEEKESWEVKTKKLKEEIDVIKTSIQTLDKQHVKVMADAEEATQKTRKASLFQLMRQTTENIRELRSDLNNKQEKMAKLMAKKPKLM